MLKLKQHAVPRLALLLVLMMVLAMVPMATPAAAAALANGPASIDGSGRLGNTVEFDATGMSGILYSTAGMTNPGVAYEYYVVADPLGNVTFTFASGKEPTYYAKGSNVFESAATQETAGSTSIPINVANRDYILFYDSATEYISVRVVTVAKIDLSVSNYDTTDAVSVTTTFLSGDIAESEKTILSGGNPNLLVNTHIYDVKQIFPLPGGTQHPGDTFTFTVTPGAGRTASAVYYTGDDYSTSQSVSAQPGSVRTFDVVLSKSHTYSVAISFSAPYVPPPTPAPTPTPAPAPSPSSDPSPSVGDTVEIPAKEGSTAVEVTKTKEDEMTLNLPEEKVAEIVASAKEEAKVTFDLTSVQETKNAVLDTKAVETIAEAGVAVQLKLPDADITLDTEALNTLTKEAQSGESIRVEAATIPQETLTPTQQEIVKNYDTVVNIDVYVGEKKVNVPLTVSVPYTLKEGEDPEHVCVWYLDDDGNLTQLECAFDPETGTVTFTIPHQSLYVVGYNAQSSYQIKFDAGSGKGSWKTLPKEAGANCTIIAACVNAFSRSNYKFAFFLGSDGERYYKGQTFKVTGNLTLTAKYFRVKAPSGLSAGQEGKTIRLRYNKITGADGYQLQISTSKNFSSATTGTANKKGYVKNVIKTCKGKALKAGTTYYIRVRGYVEAGGKKTYTKWATVNIVVK